MNLPKQGHRESLKEPWYLKEFIPESPVMPPRGKLTS